MSTVTKERPDRVASDALRAELDLALAGMPDGPNPPVCGVAAITVAIQTGEVLVVCVCAMLGRGPDEDSARADLADAHAESALPSQRDPR